LVPFKLTDEALECVGLGNSASGASAELSECLGSVNDVRAKPKLKAECKVLSKDMTPPRSVRS